MRSSASILVLAVLALGGCARPFAVAPLPDLDPGLVADCNSYPAKPGQDARVVAKAKNKAMRCERAKKHAIVESYRELQDARK